MNKRLEILVRLTDVPPGYGQTIADLADDSPWVPAALYGEIYSLEREGLVGVNRRQHPMIVGLVEHPDLAAMHPGVTVPDDGERHE